MEAYCVKCKEKREMNDPHQIEMKNGKPAVQGICPTKIPKYPTNHTSGDKEL